MNKKKMIILIAIVLIVISLLYFLLPKPKEENIKYQYVDDVKQLDLIKNESAFNLNDYVYNSREFIEEKSKYLLLYLNMFINEKGRLDIVDLSEEQLYILQNALFAGAGQNVCYKEDFFKKQITNNFGIVPQVVHMESNEFKTEKGYVCFEELHMNMKPDTKVVDYKDERDRIVVILTNELLEYRLVYQKNGSHITFQNVRLLNSFVEEE